MKSFMRRKRFDKYQQQKGSATTPSRDHRDKVVNYLNRMSAAIVSDLFSFVQIIVA